MNRFFSWLFGPAQSRRQAAPRSAEPARAAIHERALSAMVDRNNLGIKSEKFGDFEAAIALYEQNVNARFDGSHPYERLLVIYRRDGRDKDMRRVAAACIANVPNMPPKLAEKCAKLMR